MEPKSVTKNKTRGSKARDSERIRPSKGSGKIGVQQQANSVKRKVSQPVNNEHRSVAGQRKSATKKASQLKSTPQMTQKRVVDKRRAPVAKAARQRKR